MKQELGEILFLGSIPGDSAEDVMRLCALETVPYVSFLPDGETGNRHQWVQFLAANIYHGHPAMITVQSPDAKDGKERWYNEAYGEKNWLFKIKDGVKEIHFEKLGYADEAKKSYRTFCKLRNTGVIPKGVRFQVSLPLTESATRIYITNSGDFEILKAAYEAALLRELDSMLQTIPADDLVVQWDMALEVLFTVLDGKTLWAPEGEVIGRLLKTLNLFASHLPSPTLIGCHLCYGDVGHKHMVEPADLTLAVNMANATIKGVSHKIDYFHMPVPVNRNDDGYFESLKNLNIGNSKLYLGLIHLSDGIEGAKSRMNSALKYVSNFGIATECGMGRRPKDTIPELLRIHKKAAEILQ
jgi:hypothetical protein